VAKNVERQANGEGEQVIRHGVGERLARPRGCWFEEELHDRLSGSVCGRLVVERRRHTGVRPARRVAILMLNVIEVMEDMAFTRERW